MDVLNNIIFISLSGFIIFFLILGDVFWGEVKNLEKTNKEPNKRLIWGLGILDGFFFLTFIVSLITKLIKNYF